MNQRLSWFLILFFSARIVLGAEVSSIFGLGQENFYFIVDQIGQGRSSMQFNPNMSGVIRLGLNWGDFGIGYGFRGSNTNLNSQQGETAYTDLQLSYHNKKWGLDGYYQSYEGFYLERSSKILLYPSLKFQHHGLMGRFSLSNDEEFSVGGLYDQSDNITKTSGKYYLLGGVQEHILDSPNSLLTTEDFGVNTDLENFRNMKTTSLNFGIGAGKYWVSNSLFFIGGLVDLIGTSAFYKYQSTDGNSTNNYFTLSYNIKLGAGYSGEKYKYGLGISTDTIGLNLPGKSTLQATAYRGLWYLRIIF